MNGEDMRNGWAGEGRTLTRDHNFDLRLELVLAGDTLEEEVRVANHAAHIGDRLIWGSLPHIRTIPREEDERQLCGTERGAGA